MERTTTPLSQIRKYLAALPAKSRRELRKLRQTIRSTVPSADEAFAYGIPAFKLGGRPLIYYAAWKNHTSLYPMTARIKRAHVAEMKRYKTLKGTIQFPLSDPLPVAFIKRLVKTRVAEVRASLKAR